MVDIGPVDLNCESSSDVRVSSRSHETEQPLASLHCLVPLEAVTMRLTTAPAWVAAALLSSLAAASTVPNVKRAPVPYKVQTPPLDTDWTYEVGTNPWPEHPRPQLQRDTWQSLNGIWTYRSASADGATDPPSGPLDRETMIPSCIESGLSGLQELNVTNMWFARDFKVPRSWSGKSIMLNFEAVDYQATVFVNGVKVGTNTGGYFRFSIDVTKNVKLGQNNHLYVLPGGNSSCMAQTVTD